MFFKILAFAFAVETGFLSGGVWNYSDRNVGWVDVGALYTTMEARVEAGPVYVNGAVITYFTHTQLTKVVQYTSRLPTERTGMLM